MKHKKTAMIILGVIVLLAAGGKYLYEQHLTPPGWMTYPYEVRIWHGQAYITAYLSEEKEINIPKRILGVKVVSIYEDAFSSLGTEAIIQNIPEGVRYGMNIYHQESESFYCFSLGEAWISEYAGNEEKVEIPEEVWGRKVTKLGSFCFYDSSIEEVVIPETVTEIEWSAFKACKNLKQITLPSGLEDIGTSAFYGSGIEQIELPESVKKIEAWAFAFSAVEEIRGLENVEEIERCAFRGTPWEESIEGEFVCIGDVLYLYRGENEEVVIPSTVKDIRGAFLREEDYPYPIKVEKVFIPDSVTAISAKSFSGQEGVEVYIPETVVSLGYDDFGTDTIFASWARREGTIVTTEGSPAEAYAIKHKIPYRIITEEEFQHDLEEAMSKQSSGS